MTEYLSAQVRIHMQQRGPEIDTLDDVPSYGRWKRVVGALAVLWILDRQRAKL
jgi:hypothetical protein